eukprot:2475916-Amphidinium_carterae.2
MQVATGSSSADAPKRLAMSEWVERKKTGTGTHCRTEHQRQSGTIGLLSRFMCCHARRKPS